MTYKISPYRTPAYFPYTEYFLSIGSTQNVTHKEYSSVEASRILLYYPRLGYS